MYGCALRIPLQVDLKQGWPHRPKILIAKAWEHLAERVKRGSCPSRDLHSVTSEPPRAQPPASAARRWCGVRQRDGLRLLLEAGTLQPAVTGRRTLIGEAH